ncbi:MAG: chromate transporter, partial [Rhodoferax sp.]|nr:chromate transporter [Rhodoferax sp.]
MPPEPTDRPAADPGAAQPRGVPAPDAVPLGEALRFWFRLGWIGFGGPAGQIALMHRELVLQRRWISQGRFLHALNYCMLLPGPEAQQLATYLGWLMHRRAGGVAAGALFVLPSLLILTGLSWLYMAWGQLPLVQAVFQGIKPAVCAIVLQAAVRIGTRTLRHPALWALAVVSFLAVSWLALPFPAVVAGAALAGALGARLRPHWLDGGRAPHPGAA